jgi:hypothetical protein
MAKPPQDTPTLVTPKPGGDRRKVDVGPPTRSRERRVRHTTPSGLVATDGLKMACPCCGGSESAVMKTSGEIRCAVCDHVQSEVVKVRGLIEEDAIRRRRECASCGARFPTIEAVDQVRLAQEAVTRAAAARNN